MNTGMYNYQILLQILRSNFKIDIGHLRDWPKGHQLFESNSRGATPHMGMAPICGGITFVLSVACIMTTYIF